MRRRQLPETLDRTDPGIQGGAEVLVAISLIIPAFNEAENVVPVIRQAVAVLEQLELTYEIIVVDDGSTDGTPDRVRTVVDDTRVRLVSHETNRGLGSALKTGYNASEGEWICYFPADGQFPISELSRMLPLVEAHDVVLSRPPPGTKSLARHILSSGQRILTNWLVGDFAWKHGIPRLFRRAVWDAAGDLDASSGFFNLEFAMRSKQKGFRMTEVEIQALPRMSGQSKVANVRTILQTYKDMRNQRKAGGTAA